MLWSLIKILIFVAIIALLTMGAGMLLETQGGIQMGFDAPEAKMIAVQTCLGAASILNSDENTHPEAEIDKVTTPKGCTISGLNEMEHKGLSSALIQGLMESYKKINEI